jgi:type IV secretion system protein VirB10
MFKMGSVTNRPPGVIPKYARFYVMGTIVLIIVLASAFSGKKTKTTDEKKNALVGPSETQLANFKKALERQRTEAEEVSRRLEEQRQREDLRRQKMEAQPSASSSPSHLPPPYRPPQYVYREPQQSAGRPTTSFAVSAKEEEPDRAGMLAWQRPPANPTSSVDGGLDEDEPDPGRDQSGQFLPERENNGLYRVYRGTTIETALSTGLEGSFTGPVECVVQTPLLTKDKSTVLIPEGAIFLGEANQVQAQNQTRLAVTFDEVLFPNGYSIRLKAAPGLDGKGGAGLKDKVNNHRARTFAGAAAVGLINGLSNLGLSRRGGTNVFLNPVGSAATNTLNRLSNSVPTIIIRAGHKVLIYIPEHLLIPAYSRERTSSQ